MPMRLFRNSIFRTSFATSAMVGFAMFGAITFLPLFLQVVHGASPTSSGLQLLPIMVTLLICSIASGRRIAATGRYRRFPIVGTALIAARRCTCSPSSASPRRTGSARSTWRCSAPGSA